MSDDHKSELNRFIQKFIGRPVTKTDITYSTNKFGPTQFQAIVRLNCLQGQEFAGDLLADPKAAEKSAAQQALVAHADTYQTIMSAPADKKRKPAAGVVVPFGEPALKKIKETPVEKLPPELNPAITPKTTLNSLAMKLCKRLLTKTDTVYTCSPTRNGYQATVQLACLPGEWATRVWAGLECSTKQKAEQSAAEQALFDLQSDPEILAEAAKPKGGGKGSGMGKGWGKGWGKMMMMAWAPTDPAEQIGELVSNDSVTGEVIEWRGTFGFIQPTVPINHPSATMRQGKVFAHKKSFLEGVETVAQGQNVSFKLYAGSSGLNAQEVILI